ncbi:MAG: FAD-dependent oxidoreductase [Alphaproteobacteria bacterium]|nr:FAD-dependent oxidoreductase [Alphaproteobacteria bacterium]
MAEQNKIDIVIFGAGIAGLWVFNRLKSLNYNVLLLEKNAIGGQQTMASQGIIHSGLKFTIAGKVSKLAENMSQMPVRWRNALSGTGEIDLTGVNINANSQYLLIPKGFIGGLTHIITRKLLGSNVQDVPRHNWPTELKNSGFDGSMIHMGELVIDVPSLVQTLAEPYRDCIKKVDGDPFEFLDKHKISAQRIIFCSAASNLEIAAKQNDKDGLETQHRPLLQGLVKNAPFPLFAHLIGKSEKPIATITTHSTVHNELVWYLGGGVAERAKSDNPEDVYQDIKNALKKYLPAVDINNFEWGVLPIDRVEGKSKTDQWMPDTPTLHNTNKALYAWPTKLTFAPLLSDMIIADIEKRGITSSKTTSDFSMLEDVDYALAPWDKVTWKK